MGSRSLITTIPSASSCHCGRLIVVGLSEGLRAAVDLTALDLLAQVVAARAGLWVYWIRPTGLHLRETVPDLHPWHVLLPEHRCTIAWPPRRTVDTATIAPVHRLYDGEYPY